MNGVCSCVSTEEHLNSCEAGVSAAAADGAAPEIVAARIAGNVGDVLGGLHEECVAAGRLAGRVEVLTWAQAEIQLSLEAWKADRFADTRALEEFLLRVQDSLRAVQDGSGEWAGLVRSDLGGTEAGANTDNVAPGT